MTTTEGHPAAGYLEALYEMGEESIPMVQARVAEWMGMSRASVSGHVKRLIRDGLLRADGRTLSFTPEGESIARALVRRHRLEDPATCPHGNPIPGSAHTVDHSRNLSVNGDSVALGAHLSGNVWVDPA